jgi:hypothetical protein
MAPDTKCHLIDGLLFVETKEVKRIGAETTLQELRAFEMVQVDTGVDDDEQPRIMSILPKRKNGVAMFIATGLMALASFGCSGATYSYSYSCFGQGCAPPPMRIGYMYPPSIPQQAQVVYVDRPMEVRVLRDGTPQMRRAAMPRRSFK